jgi:hypothetical protein
MQAIIRCYCIQNTKCKLSLRIIAIIRCYRIQNTKCKLSLRVLTDPLNRRIVVLIHCYMRNRMHSPNIKIIGSLNSWVQHPVASLSLKFTKVQVPPYATTVFVFTLYYTIHSTCFGLVYRPSSGVIYKHNISKSYWPQRIRWFKVIIA